MITLFTLGIGLGNYGMISILIGQISLAFIVFMLRTIMQVSTVFESHSIKELYSLIPNVESPQYPSMWLTQMFFFMLTLILNAKMVMNRHDSANTGSDPMFAAKVYNRKARCTLIMVVCSIMLVVLVGYRMKVEIASAQYTLIGALGILFSLLLGGAGAGFWYLGASSSNTYIGIGDTDIFGISQQLITVKQADIKTMCELVHA